MNVRLHRELRVGHEGCPGENHLWFTDAVTDKDVPSPYFGEYPHGAYWSAEVPQGAQDEEPYEVGGTTIRFMPDDTVAVPLWDDEGLLPEDPLWLNTVLGLSLELVADIVGWSEDWNASGAGGQRFANRQHQEQQRRLDAEARALVERIRSQPSPGLTVVLEM